MAVQHLEHYRTKHPQKRETRFTVPPLVVCTGDDIN
jgi:hypothetical protein